MILSEAYTSQNNVIQRKSVQDLPIRANHPENWLTKIKYFQDSCWGKHFKCTVKHSVQESVNLGQSTSRNSQAKLVSPSQKGHQSDIIDKCDKIMFKASFEEGVGRVPRVVESKFQPYLTKGV